jgi:Flp pilus assembly pilin Flp
MRHEKNQSANKTFQPGVAVTEYGLLLGLVGLLALTGLSTLGGSTSNLLRMAGDSLGHIGEGFWKSFDKSAMETASINSAPSVSSTDTKTAAVSNIRSHPGRHTTVSVATTIHPAGGGYYNMSVDPTTGQPVLKIVDGSAGVNVNVNSVEGSRYNALGGMMLANKLDELAAAQSDPILKDYYTRLATYAYYLGGAEGVLDNIPEISGAKVMFGYVDVATGSLKTYTMGDGLRDIYNYQQQFRSLLANPPTSADPSEIEAVLPYAADVSNISQQYLNAYQQFITPNGLVPQNFGDPSFCSASVLGGCGLGVPGPGAALADASKAVTTPTNVHEMVGVSYDALVSLDTLKANADLVLEKYKVQNEPVVATFTDAKTVNAQSSSN